MLSHTSSHCTISSTKELGRQGTRKSSSGDKLVPKSSKYPEITFTPPPFFTRFLRAISLPYTEKTSNQFESRGKNMKGRH